MTLEEIFKMRERYIQLEAIMEGTRTLKEVSKRDKKMPVKQN